MIAVVKTFLTMERLSIFLIWTSLAFIGLTEDRVFCSTATVDDTTEHDYTKKGTHSIISAHFVWRKLEQVVLTQKTNAFERPTWFPRRESRDKHHDHWQILGWPMPGADPGFGKGGMGRPPIGQRPIDARGWRGPGACFLGKFSSIG